MQRGLTADTRVLCWRRWQIDTDDFAHPVRLKKTGFAPVSNDLSFTKTGSGQPQGRLLQNGIHSFLQDATLLDAHLEVDQGHYDDDEDSFDYAWAMREVAFWRGSISFCPGFDGHSRGSGEYQMIQMMSGMPPPTAKSKARELMKLNLLKQAVYTFDQPLRVRKITRAHAVVASAPPAVRLPASAPARMSVFEWF